MPSSLETIDFLARSTHRTGVLDALAEGARDRHELCMATGASSPTIGRVLSDFEHRHWIVRNGSSYGLTPLGEFVADRFADLREAMETERELRDVWGCIPREMEGFSVDLFDDAVVSAPVPERPYEPGRRLCQLVQDTASMRGFGTSVFHSADEETVREHVIDGMDYEYIFTPKILRATVAWDPELVAHAVARRNCAVLLHDDLPDEDRCGLGIFDDRVGIFCHDADTGVLRAVIDTDDPDARDWAVSVYDRHRADARPVSANEGVELFAGGLVA